MRTAAWMLVTLPLLAPGTAGAASGAITCAQIPDAQRFINGLKPGPNTAAAQRHLDAAKRATSDKQCITELGKVNYFAKRSAAADKRIANAKTRKPAANRVLCADALHQDRPGGTDYKGPPVPGCTTPRL
ncbi:MAG: hypothetical protein ACLQJR_26480 [Stellaceae bacterium]